MWSKLSISDKDHEDTNANVLHSKIQKKSLEYKSI